jgi:hypothetical protein
MAGCGKGLPFAEGSLNDQYVLTSAGTIIDIEGFVPGLLGTASKMDQAIFTKPTTIETETGEKWPVFGRKILGGEALVGVPLSDGITDADERLARKEVCAIDVDRAPRPAFLRWEDGARSTRFYIRQGNKSTDLDGERIWRYITTKWS